MCWGSHSWPSDHEYSAITTNQGSCPISGQKRFLFIYFHFSFVFTIQWQIIKIINSIKFRKSRLSMVGMLVIWTKNEKAHRDMGPYPDIFCIWIAVMKTAITHPIRRLFYLPGSRHALPMSVSFQAFLVLPREYFVSFSMLNWFGLMLSK